MTVSEPRTTICPSCQATDNNAYTDANGVRMRSCGRCMIQWRESEIERAEPSRGAPQREQFEEWAAEAYGGDISKYLVRDPKFPDEYKPADIQWAWKAWEESANREASGHVVLLEALRRLVAWDKKWPKRAYIVEYGMISQSERELNEICERAEAAIQQAERGQ